MECIFLRWPELTISTRNKKETAVANDKAIRPVFIGKISLTLSFPDPIKL
jgi:hypothetical protein